MVTLDYIVLAILVISAVAGAFRGFLREAFSVVAWILAVWLAWRYAPLLAPRLGGVLRDPVYGLWAARALILLPVVIAGYYLGAVVNHFVRLSMFSGLDRLLGFLLGLVRGLVIIGIGIILAQATRLDDEGWWRQSRLVTGLKPAAGVLRTLAGDHLPSRLAGER
ncbi:MAG TPA: CvpA family protein [Steroidobacteraceae bacterium]|nr:CvpA family protein [Steroidobacteraceae bacterium]